MAEGSYICYPDTRWLDALRIASKFALLDVQHTMADPSRFGVARESVAVRDDQSLLSAMREEIAGSAAATALSGSVSGLRFLLKA